MACKCGVTCRGTDPNCKLWVFPVALRGGSGPSSEERAGCGPVIVFAIAGGVLFWALGLGNFI